MDLRNLIVTRVDIARLSKDLDELGHPGRLWAVHQWTPSDMAKLWDAAHGFRPITLDDFVPSSVEPLVEVIHHGKNSLGAFQFFEKRFCRPKEAPKDGEPPHLFGLNRQSISPATGPGYFVAHPAAGEGAAGGEVDIDYTMLAKEKVPSWPPIEPAGARLGRFIYQGTVDVMRGISSHVTIGRARRKRGWMNAWFVLVREDPKPAAAA